MSKSNGVATSALAPLNPATVVDPEKLAVVIDKFIEADPADADHRLVIDGLRRELRALVTDEAWQAVLRLDDAVRTRLGDLAVGLVQWGFAEGLRYGGGSRRRGAP